MGYARTISGISYKTLVRIALPTVAFRNANEGAEAKTGKYENRRVETFIFDPRWQCDKAIADRHEDGPQAFIALEASAIMEASWQHLATQFYYGTGTFGDTKGFPGLVQVVNSGLVVDAEGTTGDTASSVWAVKFGPKDVGWVWGANGQLALDEVRVETVLDDNNKKYDAYVQAMLAYPGLQCLRVNSIGRIKRLTEDSGKGLTDALLAKLLAKFPVGIVPDVFLMTKRSLEQLRTSRTATNATGAPAPTPAEAFGVPIQPTESIKNTEALTL